MTMFLSSGPGAGLEPRRQEVTLLAHEAFSKGDVAAIGLDINDKGQLYKTRDPAAITADTSYAIDIGLFAVAIDDVAQLTEGRFLVSGIIDCEVDGTTAILAGQPLSVKAASTSLVLGTTPADKLVGWALEPQDVASGVIISVMFDGINGFGTVHS